MMPDDSANNALDRVLAAVGECLDRKSAESLLRLRADAEMQARIEELADKCIEGIVTLLFLIEVPQSWASDGPKALGNTQTPISHHHSYPPERTKQ
jgi:hypothetical protein